MTMAVPTYCFDTYEKIAALRAAIGNETKATSRHFTADANGFCSVALDPSLELPIYIGVYGRHPMHGDIGIFWPQGTDNRDHGYWCMSGRAS